MHPLDEFVVAGHRKVIGHYRWLLETARSDSERQDFERRMTEEAEALARWIAERREKI